MCSRRAMAAWLGIWPESSSSRHLMAWRRRKAALERTGRARGEARALGTTVLLGTRRTNVVTGGPRSPWWSSTVCRHQAAEPVVALWIICRIGPVWIDSCRFVDWHTWGATSSPPRTQAVVCLTETPVGHRTGHFVFPYLPTRLGRCLHGVGFSVRKRSRPGRRVQRSGLPPDGPKLSDSLFSA